MEEKSFTFITFHPCKAWIFDSDEQSQNMPEKLVPFETFQFSKGFKFVKDEQPLNIYEKFFTFLMFKFFNPSIPTKDFASLNIYSKFVRLFFIIICILSALHIEEIRATKNNIAFITINFRKVIYSFFQIIC